MNYYERIQRSIDYIEQNLTGEITVEACAKEAFMSVSGYYRMFLSIVGYSVKEYIRLRRLTLAWHELSHGEQSVIAIAMKYGYQSPDSFARAFKSRFGVVPSRVNGVSIPPATTFARVNIMEQLFEHSSEQYPDIKVIRELAPMKVACFTYYGDHPEDHAFAALKKWAQEHDVFFHESGYRVFGYNNPDPTDVDSNETYGYEACVTIPDALYDQLPDVPEGFERGTYNSVRRRILPGGKYAVMSVRRGKDGDIGMAIMQAWKRFGAWLRDSRYSWGGKQYLEEHFGFTQEDDHIGGVDLYISVE